MLSRMFEEHTSGASSADTMQVSVLQTACSTEYTCVELLELPLSRDHRAVLLLLFLLSDPEVDHRPTVRAFSELQVLSVAIALVYAVHEDVHRDTGRDELVGGKVYRERLWPARYWNERLDEAISVRGSEFL